MSEREADQTFWEHLDVLRGVLMRILLAALLCGVLAFCCRELLFDVILAPKDDDFVTYRLINRIGGWFGSQAVEFHVPLINTALAQQFMIHMKMAFSAGLLCVSPYILYQLMLFIAPALHDNERRYINRVVGAGYAMFLAGMLLSYFLIFPLTFRFLGTYQVAEDVVNTITLDSYVSTLMGMSLMMGLVFELPILCWLLAKMGILDGSAMRRYRRHAIVIILIVAAVITPTSDLFTLSLVSLPMWLLYEISIRVVSKTKKQQLS